MSMIYCADLDKHIDTDFDVEHYYNCKSCNTDVIYDSNDMKAIMFKKPNNENYDDYVVRRVKELEEQLKSANIREDKLTQMIEDIYKLTNDKYISSTDALMKIHWRIYETFYNVVK